jgi:hypothetical protein
VGFGFYDLFLSEINKIYGQVWWLMPTISVIQETDIGRIVVEGHPNKKFVRPPPSQTTS